MGSNTTYHYKIDQVKDGGEILTCSVDAKTEKDITPPTITEPSTSDNPSILIFDGNGTK